MDAHFLIEHLQLQPHPEGGFYRRMYESARLIHAGEDKTKKLASTIYYLLTDKEKSRFHRLCSDELWFFHRGGSVEIVLLERGSARTIALGNDFEKGESPQYVIPANTWFAAHIKGGEEYALMSCAVIPEFSFAGFELAAREVLLVQYPHLEKIIMQFT